MEFPIWVPILKSIYSKVKWEQARHLAVFLCAVAAKSITGWNLGMMYSPYWVQFFGFGSIAHKCTDNANHLPHVEDLLYGSNQLKGLSTILLEGFASESHSLGGFEPVNVLSGTLLLKTCGCLLARRSGCHKVYKCSLYARVLMMLVVSVLWALSAVSIVPIVMIMRGLFQPWWSCGPCGSRWPRSFC